MTVASSGVTRIFFGAGLAGHVLKQGFIQRGGGPGIPPPRTISTILNMALQMHLYLYPFHLECLHVAAFVK